jgi:hypothetical protein
MKRVYELAEKNFLLYAANNYNNPRCLDVKEFHEDVHRFKYVKKLLKKYQEKGILQERLILNHLIVIHNMFHIAAATRMCFFKISETHWPALKTFLLYLNYIPDGEYLNIPIDLQVARTLQKL